MQVRQTVANEETPMVKRTTLLATVALPIFSLVWQPVEAAMVRPLLPLVEKSDVTKVQSEEEEIIRKKRKREDDGGGQNRRERNREAEQQQDNRQERRKKREAEGDQQQQENRQERRKKQREAEGDQQQQENRQERRKKQREAEGDLQQQENRQERRKKQREAEADQQQQENRQERRKKQREADQQQQEQNQGTWRAEDRKDQREKEADRQKQENTQKTREERRQKQRDAEADQQRRDADQQRAREERRKKQREAESNQKQDEQKARQERREKQREAEREGKRPDETAGRPRRERDKDRERIARDPSGTTDTIELPFTDGAAVLDSDKDWDNRRDRSRDELRRERKEKRRDVRVRVPESDRDAQVGWEDRDRVRYESGDRERGERRDRRPRYDERDGWRVEREIDDRTVINFDGGIIVRSDDGRRLSRRATETYYEDLPNGRIREVIVRPNGDRVVTIRNRYGDIIQRSRIDGGGREYVMYYAPEIDRDSRPTFVDPGERLPPMRLTIPVDEYIIDTSAEDDTDYRAFLDRPPVEPVERVYTLDEVKYSARIRDKVRRIDLDTITFATGSADISMNQASTLKRVADAMNEILDKDPGETFLIEGHTDAVGSDESNLVLSDERAEAVANILTDVYDIAPENLATQGYGERFLKIDTDAAEQLNRRVTIRRVTPLVKPVAMAE
jgi:outer membrane protein OmpA-like peptidoglycan-associated protein